MTSFSTRTADAHTDPSEATISSPTTPAGAPADASAPTSGASPITPLTAPAPDERHHQLADKPVPVMDCENVDIFYGSFRAVTDVSLGFGRHEITARIGPRGCGKSTLLRSLNRMNDLIPGARVTGQINYHEEDIYGADVDPIEVRRRIGMVF